MMRPSCMACLLALLGVPLTAQWPTERPRHVTFEFAVFWPSEPRNAPVRVFRDVGALVRAPAGDGAFGIPGTGLHPTDGHTDVVLSLGSVRNLPVGVLPPAHNLPTGLDCTAVGIA